VRSHDVTGSAHARLRGALASGNATIALQAAAAAELYPVPVNDALAIVVLLRDDERRFDRAVVRWHARFCLGVSEIAPSEALLVLAALRSLSGPDAEAGAAALIAVCERHGFGAAAEALRGLSK
jgi:hypothetical protein